MRTDAADRALGEDNASCILMSKNSTNRERSRHFDERVHFLRDMVRDGAVKLIKCAGTQNVADALTKSLPLQGESEVNPRSPPWSHLKIRV